MSTRKQGAGRKGAEQQTRELVSLASGLVDENKEISASVVAQRFGISLEEANKRLQLLIMASDTEGFGIPVYSAEDTHDDIKIALVPSAKNKGRLVKLTKTEADALVAALKELGLSENDLLFKKLESSLPSEASLEEIKQRLFVHEFPEDLVDALDWCTQALTDGCAVDFDYQGLADSSPQHRRVIPSRLRKEDVFWYLEAFDLDCQAQRVFRFDRMGEVRLGDIVPHQSRESEAPVNRMVELTFYNKRFLTLLNWNKLEILKTKKDTTYARIPYYGGMWLPRMIAACAGTVLCGDKGIQALAEDYARSLVDRLS